MDEFIYIYRKLLDKYEINRRLNTGYRYGSSYVNLRLMENVVDVSCVGGNENPYAVCVRI